MANERNGRNSLAIIPTLLCLKDLYDTLNERNAITKKTLLWVQIAWIK